MKNKTRSLLLDTAYWILVPAFLFYGCGNVKETSDYQIKGKLSNGLRTTAGHPGRQERGQLRGGVEELQLWSQGQRRSGDFRNQEPESHG